MAGTSGQSFARNLQDMVERGSEHQRRQDIGDQKNHRQLCGDGNRQGSLRPRQ